MDKAQTKSADIADFVLLAQEKKVLEEINTMSTVTALLQAQRCSYYLEITTLVLNVLILLGVVGIITLLSI